MPTSDAPVMLPIDAQVLRAIAPRPADSEARRRQSDIIDATGAVLQQTLQHYDITTRPRIAHFLAQICHESDGFKTTEEYADGWAYEGREDLGNTQQGDGPRYKGRGLLQLTGRSNYRTYGQALGVDLEGYPERAADPVLSLAIAGEYWKRRNLNAAADSDNLEAVTVKVNGGLNGLESRRQYLNKAKAELARIEQLVRHGQEPDTRPVLALGSRGDAVGRLQTMLRQRGFDIGVDQDFGLATELAVKAFQTSSGLKPDGVVAAVTWNALETNPIGPAGTPPAAVPAGPQRYWPLERGYQITSHFGPRWGTVHTGTDFGWPGGSANKPVYAIQAGTVIQAGQAQGYGGPDPAGWLVIDSEDAEGGGALEYGHIVREVGMGDHVRAGQRIAHINPDSAHNGGVDPHLHLSAWPYAFNQGGQSGKVDPESRWLVNAAYPNAGSAPVPSAPTAEFPLPQGFFYGPLDGPDNCVSGEYPGERAEWTDGLGRWQRALGLPVTRKWKDGKTPMAAAVLQQQKGWKPNPTFGYGCIAQREWDAVIKDGWRLPAGWDRPPAPTAEDFPLPGDFFFGPLDGPNNSVSGEYPGEPVQWRDALGRWQAALGLPVTKKWNDGKTPKAAEVLQHQKQWPPTPGVGYGTIHRGEWDAVFKEGWRLPADWDAPVKPANKAFPLPAGYLFGPLDGPDNCVSGEFPGEPASWREGLGRWQKALGLPVTQKWNDGKTRQAAMTLQLEKKWQPTPGVGYGCIGKAEWDAVIKDGWQLPKAWDPEKVTVPLNSAVLWALVVASGKARQREIIEQVGPVLQATLESYKINTFLRAAHFLAQICHESDQFNTTVEYADGWAYEGRTDLGNTQKGDGPRYKGRGLLQLTGRNNYRDYGKALGVDLENDPGRAADPVLSLKIACEYWKRNKINAMADRDDVVAVTRAINGGTNGLEQRKAYLGRAKAVLGQRGWGGTPVPGPSPQVFGQPRDMGSLQRLDATDVNDPGFNWAPGFDPAVWRRSWNNPLLTDNPPGYSGGPGPERDTAWQNYLASFPTNQRGYLPNPEAVGDRGLKLLGHAATELGTSYAWGGRGITGPGRGTLVNDLGGAATYRDDTRTGFDCSGLIYHSAWQTIGADIGTWTGTQVRSPILVDVPAGAPQRPGDLIYYGDGDAHHVGIYVAPGIILNAPCSGYPVQLDRRANTAGYDPKEGLIRARRLPC